MRGWWVFALGAAVALPGAGYARWQLQSRQFDRLIVNGAAPGETTVAATALDSLPEPVVRYLTRALPAGQRVIRATRLQQRGEFFLNGSWRPLRASQLFSSTPPAFMWDARISMAPFLPVYVRDAYVVGRASMRAEVLGLYPVVAQAGAPELADGALMRYLGEAVWFPTRLLPGHGLTWEPVDADSARATLADGATRVSLVFRFSRDGDIEEISSPSRFREVDGDYVPTPWRVRALGHEVHQGLRLMSPAVAEWMLPEGPAPYWRGRVVSVSYAY